MDNHFNKIFPSFNPLNLELFPGSRIIDTYANYFSFHLFNKCTSQNIKSHIQQLDKLALESSDSSSSALVVLNTNIKNNVTTSILYIHICNKPITKTLYYALNVTSIEAELFAIRCSINQATNNSNISKIIVVTDLIHTVKRIFDLSTHLFQKHSVSILKILQLFFSQHQENYIEFWECLSQYNWYSHKVVDIETKSFKPIPMLPCKLSWDFSKKSEYNNLVKK